MIDFLNSRRTIRRYTGRPIDPALLDRLLEAACRASNTGNMQAAPRTRATCKPTA